MKTKTYKDKCFANFEKLTKRLLWEQDYQVARWGIQVRSLFEWLTYTTEELGELAKAISEFEYRNGSKKDIVKEAIQVATLSLKIAEMTMEEK